MGKKANYYIRGIAEGWFSSWADQFDWTDELVAGAMDATQPRVLPHQRDILGDATELQSDIDTRNTGQLPEMRPQLGPYSPGLSDLAGELRQNTEALKDNTDAQLQKPGLQ
jgi:hypothetical protein